MGGSKIENSKAAIKKIIENLFGEDKLHFIVYDSTVDIIFENGDLTEKDSLMKQVDAVNVRGSTNISAGLEAAMKILLKYKSEGPLQRIFLFSDGLANCGLQTHQQLFDLTKDIHKKSITTCTFGIGSDFDEELMKGIAEYGNSYYFYIETSDQIERYVSAVLGALLGVIGKDAVLKIRGKNGGVVKKIFAFDDLVKGAIIGDIKQNNLKNILVELDVNPNANVNEEEILQYELSYIPRKESEPIKVLGTMKLTNTDDESKVQEKNVEVMISLTIQQSADFDSEIIHLLENNKVKEAIEVKKKEIGILESLLGKDDSGRISSLLIKGKKALSDLESKGDSKHMMKEVKHHRNLKRMDSADFLAL